MTDHIIHSRASFLSFLLLSLVSIPPLTGHAAISTRNQLPFISTTYLERTVDLGTAPDFTFYVTDFSQKEYLYDDTSETFDVTIQLDGVTVYTGNLSAGEHTVTLPTMTTADPEVRLTIQAEDSAGRKSDLLVQRFRVIDPATHLISPVQIYTPTALDLQTNYGVYNNNTNPTTTTTGLTAMLAWASTNGYRKVVLPYGTYALDPANTVALSTGVTLDLNGSTFKLTPSSDGDSVMVEIAYCTDSHVINGTIEGDLVGHDYSVDALSEHVRGIRLGSGAEYCSFRDLTVKNITGYGSNTTLGSVYPAPPGWSGGSYQFTEAFVLGEVDETTGNVVTSGVTDRAVCATMVDISAFMTNPGFIMFGKYQGYQGNATDNWTYTASFYNASNTYIGSMTGYFYRRMYPPAGAAKARFTVHSPTVMARKTLYAFAFRYPYNCDFINIDHEDVRCVGMVPSGFNNLRVENNTFTNCGWAGACAAFDSEDGWDGSQDLVFKNNTFTSNPNSEFVAISGHNFLVEGNTIGNLRSAVRVNSIHLRDNTIGTTSLEYGPFSRNAHPRAYNNTFNGLTKMIASFPNPGEINREYALRENDFPGGVAIYGATLQEDNRKMFIYKSTVFGTSPSQPTFNGRAVDCDIDYVTTNLGFTTKWFQFENCVITNSTLQNSAGLSYIIGSDVSNTAMRVTTLQLIDNTLTNSYTYGYASTTACNWWIEGNDITTNQAYFVNSYRNFTQIGFYNNTLTSSALTFSGILMSNPSTSTMTSSQITVAGNTFTPNVSSTNTYVIRASNVPVATLTLTIGGSAANTLGTAIFNSPNLNPTMNIVYVTPPTVAYTSPANNSTFTAPATISLDATATAAGAATISKVEFYEGEFKLGEVLTPPYTLSVAPEIGSYRFTARATDSNGTINVSNPILSTVTP